MRLTPLLLPRTLGGMQVSSKSANPVSTSQHFSQLVFGGTGSVYVNLILFIEKCYLARRCDTGRQSE